MTHWQWDDREEDPDDLGTGEMQGLGESGEREYLAQVGASFDPYEDQPQARRQALLPLLGEDAGTLARAPAALLHGSGEQKVDFLLSLPDPKASIQALAAEEYVFLLKSIGLNDAGPLLAMASPRQLQACVDMDAWVGNDVDAEVFLDWFVAAREAGEDCEERFVAAQEDGLLCRVLQQKLKAIPVHPEVDQELPDDMDIFDSPDGTARMVCDPDDETASVAKQVLEALYRIDMLRARAIVKGMYWEVEAQLTDDLERSRTGRLEDAGFAPKQQALEVYAYRDPHGQAAELREIWRSTGDHQPDLLRTYAPDSDEPQLLGLALPRDGFEGSFLTRVLALMAAPDVERVQLGLVRLANLVQSARATSLAASEQLPMWARHALNTAAMGLEHLSGGDESYAALLVRVLGATELFRAGHSLVVLEHHRARRLRTALGGQNALALLEPGDAALLRALLQPVPSLPSSTGLDGSAPNDTRPVASLAELSTVRDRLRALAACVDLVARLAGGSIGEAVALAQPGRSVRLSTLLNTAIAWQVLQSQAELKPLDTDALRAFLSTAIDNGRVRPQLRSALHAGLLTRTDRSDLEVDALAGMLDQSLDRLADELGGLSKMGLLDPRYVGDALLVHL